MERETDIFIFFIIPAWLQGTVPDVVDLQGNFTGRLIYISHFPSTEIVCGSAELY